MVIKEAMKGEESLSAEEPEPVSKDKRCGSDQTWKDGKCVDLNEVTDAGGGEEELEDPELGGEEEPNPADVEKALSYIKLINNKVEYNAILKAILKYGASAQIPGAAAVTKNIYKKVIPATIKQMKESRLREDHAQSSPGGNWSQPGVVPPEPEGGEELPPEQVQEIAIQVVELLSGVGHNDIVDILNFAAENLGVVEMPPGPDVAIAEARKALKEGLITEKFVLFPFLTSSVARLLLEQYKVFKSVLLVTSRLVS